MKYQLKARPKLGDTRIITKFLLLPMILNDEFRWLERATIKQRWGVWYPDEFGPEERWENVEWVAKV